jgi:PPP family 3-phenylpropionic acid transporter
VRAWGSVGYLLSAALLGKILDLTSMKAFVSAFVAVSLLQLVTAAALPSVAVPKATRSTRGVLQQLRRREVLLFLGICTLMEVSHSGYNGFFAVYLSESGYSNTWLGVLLALPVLSEIVAMMFADRWLARRGPQVMMGIAFTTAGLRWLILASTAALVPVVASQGLHALTYGVFHVTAVHQARRLFPAHLQASAQSLYIGLTYGLGGAVGLVAAGRLYDQVGARWLFLLSALVAFAALPLVLRMAEPPSEPVLET